MLNSNTDSVHTVLNVLKKKKINYHLPKLYVNENGVAEGYQHLFTGEKLTKRVVLPLIKTSGPDIEFYQENCKDLNQALHVCISAFQSNKISSVSCQAKINNLLNSFGCELLTLEEIKTVIPKFNYFTAKESWNKLDEPSKKNFIKECHRYKEEGKVIVPKKDAYEHFDIYYQAFEYQRLNDDNLNKSKKRKVSHMTYYPGMYVTSVVVDPKTNEKRLKTEHKNKTSTEGDGNLKLLFNSFVEGPNLLYFNKVEGARTLYTLHPFKKLEDEIDVKGKNLISEEVINKIHSHNLSTNHYFIYNTSVNATKVKKNK